MEQESYQNFDFQTYQSYYHLFKPKNDDKIEKLTLSTNQTLKQFLYQKLEEQGVLLPKFTSNAITIQSLQLHDNPNFTYFLQDDLLPVIENINDTYLNLNVGACWCLIQQYLYDTRKKLLPYNMTPNTDYVSKILWIIDKDDNLKLRQKVLNEDIVSDFYILIDQNGKLRKKKFKPLKNQFIHYIKKQAQIIQKTKKQVISANIELNQLKQNQDICLQALNKSKNQKVPEGKIIRDQDLKLNEEANIRNSLKNVATPEEIDSFLQFQNQQQNVDHLIELTDFDITNFKNQWGPKKTIQYIRQYEHKIPEAQKLINNLQNEVVNLQKSDIQFKVQSLDNDILKLKNFFQNKSQSSNVVKKGIRIQKKLKKLKNQGTSITDQTQVANWHNLYGNVKKELENYWEHSNIQYEQVQNKDLENMKNMIDKLELIEDESDEIKSNESHKDVEIENELAVPKEGKFKSTFQNLKTRISGFFSKAKPAKKTEEKRKTFKYEKKESGGMVIEKDYSGDSMDAAIKKETKISKKLTTTDMFKRIREAKAKLAHAGDQKLELVKILNENKKYDKKFRIGFLKAITNQKLIKELEKDDSIADLLKLYNQLNYSTIIFCKTHKGIFLICFMLRIIKEAVSKDSFLLSLLIFDLPFKNIRKLFLLQRFLYLWH